jgi:BON domain
MTRSRIAPLALAVAACFAVPALAESNEVNTWTNPAPDNPSQATSPRATYYVTRDYVYVPVERDYYVAPGSATVYSYTPDTTAYYVQPAPVYYEGPVVIYGTPGDTDAAINADVQDAIASDPWVSGHVDADTYRGTTTLQGLVSTPGQVDRVGNDARSVDGVNHVDNQVLSRVGSY